jgi:basic membrane protein A
MPSPSARPSATASCATTFRIAYVTDVAGLRSRVDAAGWQGVQQAVTQRLCAEAELITSSRPSDYRRNLQAAVDHHSELIIAGSFLLSDPVVEAANANPGTNFVLVDPILAPPLLPNLAVLIFREDEAVYLAGTLAAMVSKTGVVAGVYGPGGALDELNRAAFERGARDTRPGVKTLGVYQPPFEGQPYENPEWGGSQARALMQQGADVIFGAGGATGAGAVKAADNAGRLCIALDPDPTAYPSGARCLLGSTRKLIGRMVMLEVLDGIDGHWEAGERQLGIAEGAVAFNLSGNASITPAIRTRLAALAEAAGSR